LTIELSGPRIAREVWVHLLGAAFVNDAHAVADEDVLAPHPKARQEIEASARSPSPAAGKPRIADVFVSSSFDRLILRQAQDVVAWFQWLSPHGELVEP
jgi:hypothetical protein